MQHKAKRRWNWGFLRSRLAWEEMFETDTTWILYKSGKDQVQKKLLLDESQVYRVEKMLRREEKGHPSNLKSK